jgi:predicted PurR-regulated permease PerM
MCGVMRKSERVYWDKMVPEGRRAVSLVILFGMLAILLVLAPDVLLVIFAGLLFGVFFGGGGEGLARRIGIGRRWGIGLFVLLILIALSGAVVGFAPVAAEQFDLLILEIPSAIERLRGGLQEYPWGEEILRRATPGALMPNGGTAATAVTTTFGALGNFAIMLFIGLYVALDPETYRRGFISLLAPSFRSTGDEVLCKVRIRLEIGWWRSSSP